MKFKKMISGIAALAIAAGLGCTAFADETFLNLAGSANAGEALAIAGPGATVTTDDGLQTVAGASNIYALLGSVNGTDGDFLNSKTAGGTTKPYNHKSADDVYYMFFPQFNTKNARTVTNTITASTAISEYGNAAISFSMPETVFYSGNVSNTNNIVTMTIGGIFKVEGTDNGDGTVTYVVSCVDGDLNTADSTSIISAPKAWIDASVNFDLIKKTAKMTVTSNNETYIYYASGLTITSVNSFVMTAAQTTAKGGAIAFDDVTLTSLDEAPETEVVAGKVKYTVQAASGDNVISTLASGEQTENFSVAVSGLPQVIENNGTYYVLDDESVTDYAKTIEIGTTDTVVKIQYTADDTIVYFEEAENLGNTNTADDEKSSNGKDANVRTRKTASLDTLSAGAYEIEVKYTQSLKDGQDKAGRNIILRDVDNTDNTANEIASLGLSDGADQYTQYTKTFTLDKETSLGISGYTNTGDANRPSQSADIDYVIIRKVPTITTVEKSTATLTEDNITNMTIVSEGVTDKPAAGTEVTSYLIKVADYTEGVPSLVIGGETLTPSGDVEYAYTGEDGATYFVIQTIGFDDADKVVFGDSEYTFTTAAE